MTKRTAREIAEITGEENHFFFNEGIVSWSPTIESARSSRWYQGQIFDRTLKYVLWGDEYYTITDRLTGDEISTDYPEEIFTMSDEEIEELDETTYTKKSEALAARKEKAEFDKLWAEIKARGE